MNRLDAPAPRGERAVVGANHSLTGDLYLLEVRMPAPAEFLPGQFAMLNRIGEAEQVFSRPLSILAAEGDTFTFLYRVVGGGTALLAAAEPGTPLSVLAPLGRPFPPPESGRTDVLVAGGVGLPPLAAWLARHDGAEATAFFGARHAGDVPWPLLEDRWEVGLESVADLPAGRRATQGLVTDLVRRAIPADQPKEDRRPHRLLACGPLPMLRAAVGLAAERSWTCLVSLEEHMGCGYGVCRGCVVPGTDGGHRTVCQDGPVLAAEDVDWQALKHASPAGADQPPGPVSCRKEGRDV